jgi:AcrR family transcriptional regulator
MSPRPQKATDEQIFAATYRAMQRLGPGELTLAAIAGEAGVTPGLLVQRFGSKRDLLLRLAALAARSAGDVIAGLRRDHPSPLAALRAYADCMARMAASPAAFARSLAYLQIDLTDPAFRRHLVRQARATRTGLESLIGDAIAARELIPATNARSLARTVEAVVGGSMLAWAFYREGPAARWVTEDVEAVIKPWVRGRGR